MKAGKLLLALAILAMGAGVCQAQTNRTRDIQRAAVRAMRNREQARKDSIEKAKAQAVIDSLNEVEAKREKQMKADETTVRRASLRNVRRARTKGTTETTEAAETADVDVSGKSGETQEYKVTKTTTLPIQKTIDQVMKEKEKEKEASNSKAKEGTSSTGSSTSIDSEGSTRKRVRRGSDEAQENAAKGQTTGNTETRERKRSDDGTSSKRTIATKKPITEGFSDKSIRDMENLAALTVPAPSVANLPSVIQSNGKAFVLTRETHDARRSMDEVFATNYENIYPGAIIWANEALANGDPTLVGLPAGKVTLRVDFNTGNKSSKVTGVINTADEVQDAIYRLVQNANYRPSPSFNYKSFYSSSAEEMAVSMKANLGFLNNKANINTKYSKSETHVYKVEDYSQKYYTVSITQEADKSKYFGEKVIWGDILEALRSMDNQVPMAIITSVAYGRRAYKVYDYSSRDFKFSGSENVKLYGQSLGSTQDIAENSETKNIWMYLDGGDVESSGSILKGDDINTAISTKLAYNPSSNQGVPLWYTVRFLATGNTVTIKTTGEYTSYSYQELPTAISVTLRNNCTHVAGAGLKMRLDYRVFKFDANGNKIVIPAENTHVENGYTRYVEGNYGFGEEKTFLLPLKNGEFIDGPIRFQVRCKTTSEGKWHNDIVDLILPDQKGIIDINVHGAIRPGGQDAYVHSSSYTKLNSYRE